MKWWNEAERLVYRSRFESVWSSLPRILVLATLPGWGKRTFMLQCVEYLQRRDPDTRVIWVVAGTDFTKRLAALSARGEKPVVLCIDARITPRGFWDDLSAILEAHPWINTIIATYDAPEDPADDEVIGEHCVDSLSRIVMHEQDLAFDAVELAELGTLLAASGAKFDTFMGGKERGCPALVGRRINRLLSRGGEGIWTHAGPSLEAGIVLLAREESARGDAFRRSRIGAVMSNAAELPSITADLIEASAGGARNAEALVMRLASLPVFDIDEDDETGSTQCVWTTTAWELLQSDETREQTRARLLRGLARVRRASLLVMELRILLELGDLDDAEELARRAYRRLLLLCDTHTAQMVRKIPGINASRYPILTMMRNQFILRTDGFSPRLRQEDREILEVLRRETASGWFAEVSRAGRLGYAAAAAGNRKLADRSITHLEGLIVQAEIPLRSTASEEERLMLVDACFLGYWAASQIDRLDTALTLAETMQAWGQKTDRLHQFDSVCLEAVQDHAGIRSLASDGVGPNCDPFNQAHSLIALEDGHDGVALQAVQRFIAELGTHNSRSTPDGLGLLVLAITSQDAATVSRIESTLNDSTDFWDDHRPSTFVTWAGILAFSAIGAKKEAAKWIERIDNAQDESALLARATYALWDSRPEETLEHVTAAMRLTNLPRLVVSAQMLGIAAQIQLGNVERAWLRLEDAWRILPAPRLFRFALRLLPESAFAKLHAFVPKSNPAIREVVDAASTDHRTLTWEVRPHLTPTEHEILRMLNQGISNAEIAGARYIAIGTLRTHLKSLYKKLGAASREEALAHAARFELIELWEGGTKGGDILR